MYHVPVGSPLVPKMIFGWNPVKQGGIELDIAQVISSFEREYEGAPI